MNPDPDFPFSAFSRHLVVIGVFAKKVSAFAIANLFAMLRRPSFARRYPWFFAVASCGRVSISGSIFLAPQSSLQEPSERAIRSRTSCPPALSSRRPRPPSGRLVTDAPCHQSRTTLSSGAGMMVDRLGYSTRTFEKFCISQHAAMIGFLRGLFLHFSESWFGKLASNRNRTLRQDVGPL